MATATFAGIDIPYVYSQIVSYEIIGERARTARNKLRQDVTGSKKVWELETRPMKKSDADSLVNHLQDNKFASEGFTIEGEYYTAYITDIEEERTQFEARDGTGWQTDGRKLTITITER